MVRQGVTLDSTANNCPQISLSVNVMQITVSAGSFRKLDSPILRLYGRIKAREWGS